MANLEAYEFERGIWHRLPVVSLIFFFLSSIKSTLKHGYQMLPGLVGILVFVDSVRQYIPLALGVFAFVFVIAVVLQFLRFRYLLGEKGISVQRGVFTRTELNLDFERIQQADIQFPWYLRPFDLRVVRLESAGAKGSEVELVGLTSQQALAVQALVSDSDLPATAAMENDSKPEEQDIAQFKLALSFADVWRIGLMQNPFIVLGIIVAFINSNDRIRDNVEARVESFIGQFPDRNTVVLVLIGISIVFITLIMLASILFAINKYYSYELTRHGQRYRFDAGLLSKLNRGFSARKLQGVSVRQGWVARAMQRVQMELAQAGGLGQKKERFLVPSLLPEPLSCLSRDLRLPEVDTWHRIHPLSIFTWSLLAGIAATFIWNIWIGLAALAGLGVILFGYWRQRGCFV